MMEELNDDDYYYCMGDEYGFDCTFPDCGCELITFDDDELVLSSDDMEGFEDDADY